MKRFFVLEFKGRKLDVDETIHMIKSITGVKITEMRKMWYGKRRQTKTSK